MGHFTSSVAPYQNNIIMKGFNILENLAVWRSDLQLPN